MDEYDDEAGMIANRDPEVSELLGLFDVPAYVRRGQDLEYALARLRDRCRRERSARLDLVLVRLRQWTCAVTRLEAWQEVFTAPIDALWPLCDAPPATWADRPAPARRQRAIAGDLIASVVRFNRRWTHFLDELDLAHANRLIDQYNRNYLFEKECSLGSARLAARFFTPKPLLTRESLLEEFPALPVPELK